MSEKNLPFMKKTNKRSQNIKSNSDPSLHRPNTRNPYIERKSLQLLKKDASLMDNAEFLSTVNHYEILLKTLESDKSTKFFTVEMTVLLRKFQKLFTYQQKSLQKIKETNVLLDMSFREFQNLENVLKEKNEIIKKLKIDLAESINQQKNFEIKSFKKKSGKNYFEESNSSVIFPVTLSQEQQIAKLRKQIITEREEFESRISEITETLEQKIANLSNFELELTALHKSKKNINKELLETKTLYQVEVQNHDIVNQQLTYNKLLLENKQSELDKLKIAFQSTQIECKNKTKQFNEIKKRNVELTKCLETLKQSNEELKESLKVTENKFKSITLDRDQFRKGLETCKLELKEEKKDTLLKNAECKKHENTVFLLEQTKYNNTQKINLLQCEVVNLEKSLEKTENELRKKNDLNTEMETEISSLNKTTAHYQNQITIYKSDIQTKEHSIEVLSNEKRGLQSQLRKEKLMNKELNNNKSKLMQDIEQMTKEIKKLNDDVIFHKQCIKNLEKQLDSCEEKCTSEQKLHAQTKEKFLDCKRITDKTQSEYSKLKKEHLSLNEIMENLTTSLRLRDKKLSSVLCMNDKLKKNVTSLKNYLQKTEVALKNCQEENITKDKLIQLLNGYLEDCDKTIKLTTKNLEKKTVQNEVLNDLVAKIIEEMNLLKQKDNILRYIIIRGEKQYSQRLEEAKLLKSEIKNLSRQNMLFAKKARTVALLNKELRLTAEKLKNEKLKIKALEDDNTKNLHRWRLLEGNDPEKYQLIIKNQSLQKQLVKNTSKLAQTEVELDKSKKQNEKLTDVVKKKQSNAENFRDLLMYKNKYQQTKIVCDSLTSQVNMFTIKFTEFTQENKILKEELNQLKTDIYLKKLSSRLGISKT